MDDGRFPKVAQPATVTEMPQLSSQIAHRCHLPAWRRTGTLARKAAPKKTVGAGISPSASLSDQKPVTAATSVKSSRQASLDFDGPASRRPRATPVPDHADLHPCGLRPACHRRFFPAFMAASVRRRRWHAFRGTRRSRHPSLQQASLLSFWAVRASGNPPCAFAFRLGVR